MNFKRSSIILAFVFLAGSIQAQVNQLTPQIFKSGESFTQTETSSTTQFHLKATEKQIEELKRNAMAIAKSANLEIVSISNGEYKVKLNVTAQNHPEYVHKMFLHLGFEYFLFDGKKRAIEELPSVLKSLLK